MNSTKTRELPGHQLNNLRMNDCKDIDLWIETIHENADILHLDYTPSVQKLSECGLKAALAVLPLLNNKDVWQRYRAQRVLEGVIQRKYGWKPGSGYPSDSHGEENVKNHFSEMGNYQANDSQEKRKESIEKWEHWLQAQIQKDEKE